MRGIWLTPRDVLPLAIAAAASSALLWAAPQSRGAAPGVVIERNVEARMRDGVVLRADVYRPDAPGRFPVLLQRTPYSKSSGRAAATTLATHGYVVVIQDSRGRYTSDGVARPHDEAEDGHDAVEWAASLPYSTGKVGMFGTSYLATTTLQAASTAPPHLAAIQPSAAYSHRFADLVFQGGAFYLEDGLAWNLDQAADVMRRARQPEAARDDAVGMTPAQERLFRQSWLWYLPLKAFDANMERVVDPGFSQGVTLAGLLGRAVMRLASAPVLPFRPSHSLARVRGFLHEAEGWPATLGRPAHTITTGPLQALASGTAARAREIERWLDAELSAGRVPTNAAAINDGLVRLERTWLDTSQPADVNWYRHVIYGWNIYSMYDGQPLPGLYEAIRVSDAAGIAREQQRLREALLRMQSAVEALARLAGVR